MQQLLESYRAVIDRDNEWLIGRADRARSNGQALGLFATLTSASVAALLIDERSPVVKVLLVASMIAALISVTLFVWTIVLDPRLDDTELLAEATDTAEVEDIAEEDGNTSPLLGHEDRIASLAPLIGGSAEIFNDPDKTFELYEMRERSREVRRLADVRASSVRGRFRFATVLATLSQIALVSAVVVSLWPVAGSPQSLFVNMTRLDAQALVPDCQVLPVSKTLVRIDATVVAQNKDSAEVTLECLGAGNLEPTVWELREEAIEYSIKR